MVWTKKKGNKDTQKYAENYNQEYDKTDTQMKIYFGEQEWACN
jgi:hypothetical protein